MFSFIISFILSPLFFHLCLPFLASFLFFPFLSSAYLHFPYYLRAFFSSSSTSYFLFSFLSCSLLLCLHLSLPFIFTSFLVFFLRFLYQFFPITHSSSLLSFGSVFVPLIFTSFFPSTYQWFPNSVETLPYFFLLFFLLFSLFLQRPEEVV